MNVKILDQQRNQTMERILGGARGAYQGVINWQKKCLKPVWIVKKAASTNKAPPTP